MPAYAQAPSAILETVFARIGRERFAGVPLLNPALHVEAIGFARTEAGWTGIMLTPWFMNLMILPASGTAWQPLGLGCRRRIELPAGTFEVLGGDEAEIGPYLYCPMFSTMSVFADQATARATAEELRRHLFSAATAPLIRRRNPTGLQWHAEPTVEDEPDGAPSQASRRRFLGGGAP